MQTAPAGIASGYISAPIETSALLPGNEKMKRIETRRLVAGDREPARALFETMCGVFAEEHEELSDSYIDGLLDNGHFWAIAALSGARVIGGLTAHTLPMTRSESAEVLVYDVAVRAEYRRRGIGRALVTELRTVATKAGIENVCIPADKTDRAALDFYRALGGVESAVAFFVFESEDR